LQALQTFINSQKALLARTHSDIARLQNLKNDVFAQPEEFLANFEQILKEDSFQLGDAQLNLPRDIDWAEYDSHDPRALQNLNIDLQQKRDQRNRPSAYQRSELSALQKLVKEARCTIVDPILAIYEGVSEPEDESDDKPDPQEIRRQTEREKLRELKKRKIHTFGGLTLPSRGLCGVYIRHDVEDESPEVDITFDDCPGPSVLMDQPSSATLVSNHPLLEKISTPMILVRDRKPSAKAQSSKKISIVPTKRKAKLHPPSDLVSSPDPANEQIQKPARGKEKPKPETYKQQWSVSEQHLLEQLLEQIPDGEKNRWQKISRAMNGRRTPRQVASRVQKYFAKLKRFGV
ncbi:ZZ-type zinc finger-containing protein 3, partial [Termitomyces sp. J132]